MSNPLIAIIGCSVDESSLFENGQPRTVLSENRQVPIVTQEGSWWRLGPHVVIRMRVDGGAGPVVWVIGSWVTPENGFRCMNGSHLAHSREWVYGDLTHLGLWDEKRFGLWCGCRT